jgi:alkylation response protein AidB-like acyl-CoA dehydrogenase
MEQDTDGYSAALWGKMLELGWQGIALPEELGGQGDTLLHAGMLLEEIGRALAPVPFLTTLVSALTVMRHGSPEQRRSVGSAVAKEGRILTFAILESNPRAAAKSIQLTATREGDEFVLSGRKRFVDNFEAAEQALVAARTSPGESEDGISLFLVDRETPGVRSEPLPTLSGERQSEVTFDGVRVSAERIIGEPGQGWPIITDLLRLAAIFSCAMIVGAARKTVEMAVDHAKDRVVFGRPLGSFQAIQHMAANMITWVDGAQLLTYEALWKLDQGEEAATAVAVAKSFTNDRCQAVVREANQIHGGIAQITEFDLQLWYRRVASWCMKYGTSFEHRKALAHELGLGRGAR